MKIIMQRTDDADVVKIFAKLKIKTTFVGVITKNGKKHFFNSKGIPLGEITLLAVYGLVKKLNNQVKTYQDAAAAV